MELKIGDTIKCHDPEDLIENMYGYESVGIRTDFCYEMDGERGYWLVITGMETI